jgi:hypothetical protein
MRRSASEVIRNLEQRIARLERKATTSKSSGRRFDESEWVFFEHQDHPEIEENHYDEAMRLQDKFEEALEKLCEKEDLLEIIEFKGLSTIAFKAYASIVGHGTGLWDTDHPQAGALERAVERDRKLDRIAQEIQDLPYTI